MMVVGAWLVAWWLVLRAREYSLVGRYLRHVTCLFIMTTLCGE